jgi:sulfide:quinone oxidoreductase
MAVAPQPKPTSASQPRDTSAAQASIELYWLPLGAGGWFIRFPVAPTFDAHGVDFVQAKATQIDPQHQHVTTTSGIQGFDYLVVATGYRGDFTGIPGAGPGGPTHAITSLQGALGAAERWQQLLAEPGPGVVAAAQGTGCFGAAYEFVFNLAYQLRKHGLRRRAPITYVTAEPFLGHFGIGGCPAGSGCWACSSTTPASRPSSTPPSPRSRRANSA